MSADTEFWLEVFMESSDGRRLRIEIKHSVKESSFNTFVKAIDKAKDSGLDLNPLVPFLKNKEITFLHEQGWFIDDIEFYIHDSQALEYFKSQKEKGGTTSDAYENWWPHAPMNSIGSAFYRLHINKHVVPTRNAGMSGGYVLNEYYKENQSVIKSYRDYAPKKAESPAVASDQIIPKKTFNLTKSEEKRVRSSIINKADKSSICEAGFKPEFVDKLSDVEKFYLDDISNLKLKLMRTEVAKKCN